MSELKPEVILTYLGFEADKIKTEDDFKTQFEGKFGIKETLKKDPSFTAEIFGKRVGSIDSKLKSSAKKMGIEFSKEEIEGKQVEDVIELSFTKIAELNKKAMEDLEKSTKGTVDEQVKTWKEKYQSVESKLKDTEGLLTKTSTEFDNFKKEQVNKSKADTITGFRKSAIAKLEFKQDITPVEKMGFETVLAEKYEFDLDENSNPFVKDKKTGQRIPSKKQTGTFMTADEILQEELIANKLAKINPNGGQKVNKYANPLQVVPEGQGEQKKIYIHPGALRAAGL